MLKPTQKKSKTSGTVKVNQHARVIPSRRGDRGESSSFTPMATRMEWVEKCRQAGRSVEMVEAAAPFKRRRTEHVDTPEIHMDDVPEVHIQVQSRTNNTRV